MPEKRLFRRKSLQTSRELGFGTTDVRQRRLINPDGSYNFVRIGIPFYETFNIYHYLLSASWAKLIFIVIAWYSVFNVFFVGLYYAFCPNQITGMVFTNEWEHFWEIYFFSAQTLATVGPKHKRRTGSWRRSRSNGTIFWHRILSAPTNACAVGPSCYAFRIRLN